MSAGATSSGFGGSGLSGSAGSSGGVGSLGSGGFSGSFGVVGVFSEPPPGGFGLVVPPSEQAVNIMASRKVPTVVEMACLVILCVLFVPTNPVSQLLYQYCMTCYLSLALMLIRVTLWKVC